MHRANQIGILLGMVTGIIWVLVIYLNWPTVIGIVVSMLLGIYWAVGRELIFGRQSRDKL